jgi:hypothetical protein
LPFLSAHEITGTFNELESHLPKEAREFTDWFKNNEHNSLEKCSKQSKQ